MIHADLAYASAACTASPQGADSDCVLIVNAMKIARLQPAGLVASPAFSHVAVVPAGATTIYVGGQNGVDTTGSVVSDDIAEQSSRALDNASVALQAAGATLADVVQWTVLIAADADLRAAYRAIAPRLSGDAAPPLVTAARVAGLGVPGALIEISAIAAVMRDASGMAS